MPFKIVQTIERGETILVIVPSLWEKNGKLWWPPKRAQYKFMKDEQCTPDKKEWRLMDCVLKRNNIRTYQQAEVVLSIMEDNSDTDENDTDMVAPRTTVLQNHEVMANQSRFDQINQGTDHVSDYESTTNHENKVQKNSTITLTFDQILANQKILFEKIDKMLQILANTLENQKTLFRKLATQSVQIEKIFAQLADIKEGSSATVLKGDNPVDTETFTLKPIENQRDLISLDQLLADRGERNKLKRHFSVLCSASKGEGKTCAYKLLDIIFTRDFLCNCSWTGGSRGDTSKIALKYYKNVLKFFHSMIQTWDSTYTVQDNETFFKSITRNSKQWKSVKNLRMSSKRCRRSKDNLGKQQSSGNKIQANHDEKETKEESMQIQDYATNDDSIELNEEESLEIQEQKNEIEIIMLNNMSDDDIEVSLC